MENEKLVSGKIYDNYEAKKKFPKVIGVIYKNLGAVSLDLKDYESSQSYYQKALEIYFLHPRDDFLRPMIHLLQWCILY